MAEQRYEAVRAVLGTGHVEELDRPGAGIGVRRKWKRGAAMELWQMDVVGGSVLADGTRAKHWRTASFSSALCPLGLIAPHTLADMASQDKDSDPVELGSDRRAAGGNPYAVPLATLVAGAYVAVTEQVQVHPVASFPDVGDLGTDGGGDGDGGH